MARLHCPVDRLASRIEGVCEEMGPEPELRYGIPFSVRSSSRTAAPISAGIFAASQINSHPIQLIDRELGGEFAAEFERDGLASDIRMYDPFHKFAFHRECSREDSFEENCVKARVITL